MTLSPIKKGAKSHDGCRGKYFDGQIADEKRVVRLVGFEPNLWNTLHESCDKSKSVSLMNCIIQTNKILESLKWALILKFANLNSRSLSVSFLNLC